MRSYSTVDTKSDSFDPKLTKLSFVCIDRGFSRIPVICPGLKAVDTLSGVAPIITYHLFINSVKYKNNV